MREHHVAPEEDLKMLPEREHTSAAPQMPRVRDTERTKRDILDAAGHLFAQAGYSQVPLKAIADDVGITPAMIVHHFGSKLELLAAVARDEWGLDEESAQDLPDDIGEIARTLDEYWWDLDARSPSLALVRSLDQEAAMQLFRSEIERRITEPWRRRLNGPHKELRLKLIVGLYMGFGFFTTGALLEPQAPTMSKQERKLLVDYFARLLAVVAED